MSNASAVSAALITGATWCTEPRQPLEPLQAPPGMEQESRRLWERKLFNDYLEREDIPLRVQASPHGGDGLFAQRDIAANSTVVNFVGTVCLSGDFKDARNSVSLVPLLESMVFDGKELLINEAKALIPSIPGLSVRELPRTSVVDATAAADLILDPRGHTNPAQKANDAAFRKHIHRNTYAKVQNTANNCDLWHRIDRDATGAWSIGVEIRNRVAVKQGEECCVPYGEHYWFNRKGAKMTC